MKHPLLYITQLDILSELASNKMAQYNCLLLLVLVGIISQCFVVANSEQITLIPASADPCALGAILAVHYKSFGDDCGQTVSLDTVYDDGKPSSVSYAAAEQDKLYTLMMVDPDVPEASDPAHAYYLHWMIVNIQGGDLVKGVYKNGAKVTGYEDPLPDEGSGLHRYQFFVFAQALSLPTTAQASEPLFDVGAFMSANQLTEPLAGYQFRTEEFEFVPTTHSDSTIQGPTGSTPKSSGGSTPQNSKSSTPAPVPNDGAAATSSIPNDGAAPTTPSAGAAILKGNWATLVILATFAVFQLAR